MRIKKGDLVKMTVGKDRDKTGKVLSVFPKENKLIIEGLNLVKKHLRPRKEGEKGQRVELPRKITISNVMIICPKCGKASRVGYSLKGDIKSRICKKCQAEI